MGSNNSKYENIDIGTKCFSNIEIDKNKIGDVYLMMYSEIDHNRSTNNNNVETIGHEQQQQPQSSFIHDIHYTVLIDIAGESNDKDGPMGLEVHIVFEKISKKIQLCFERKISISKTTNSNLKNIQQDSVYLGKIENIYHKEQPLEWSFGLTRVISTKWIHDFIEQDQNGDLWSFKSNCFTFSKYLINRFKQDNPFQLIWPH